MPQTAHEARSLQQLRDRLAAGARPRYRYFWGPRPEVPGRIDASCLCNWFPAPFVAEGIVYATTEHYLMAEKARMFGDEPTRAQILEAETPLEAQVLGRRVAGFREASWEAARLEIVMAGNLHKFRQQAALGAYLRATAPDVLVEASPWDRLWGIGLAQTHPKAADPRQWQGLNLLGFALMAVRAELGE